jgi:predicted RecB family endonuclease
VDIASAVGDSTSAKQYQSQYEATLVAYHAAYYDSSVGGYNPLPISQRGSQASNSMALQLGVAAAAGVEVETAAGLVADVTELNANHSTGGIVGMRWTFAALSQVGLWSE